MGKNLLPSEIIKEIHSKLISDDWVAFGGNRLSFESWENNQSSNPFYWIKAILAFLDEPAPPPPGKKGKYEN